MLKKLLMVVLPIVLPFLVYWIGLQDRPAPASRRQSPRLGACPLVPALLSPPGSLLIASLLYYRFTSGVEPGTLNQRRPVWSNGVVKPAHRSGVMAKRAALTAADPAGWHDGRNEDTGGLDAGQSPALWQVMDGA